MARTIILKGDTARPVTIKIADDADIPAGANVTVGYQSAVRRFTGVKAGETIGVVFSADETAAFALGTFPLRISIDMNGRRVTSSNATQMVECTDDVTKGGSAIYYVDGGGSIDNIATLGEKYTMAEIRAKINEILKALGSGAAAIAVAAFLALGGGAAQAAGVTSARLDELPNDTAVVTAVDLSGLADVSAIPTKASQVGVTLDKGVITIDGAAITPLVAHQSLEGVTNYVDAATNAVMTSVDGKGYLTSESLTFANIKSTSVAAPTLADGLGYLGTSRIYKQQTETVYENGGIHFLVNGHSYDLIFPYKEDRNGFMLATTDDIPDVSKFIKADAISASDATFSNAVLAVGLNIDTNTLAAINELSTIDYTTPATTVGALLAALAAGLAALKKKTTTIETKVDAANTALEEVA